MLPLFLVNADVQHLVMMIGEPWLNYQMNLHSKFPEGSLALIDIRYLRLGQSACASGNKITPVPATANPNNATNIPASNSQHGQTW